MQFMSRRIRCLLVRAGLLAALLASAPALAATYCVSTASELQDALNQAALNTGEDNTIGLAPGYYLTADNGNAPFTFSSTTTHALYMGNFGYPTCDPLTSGPIVLDGSGVSAVLSISSQGIIGISRLTIQNGRIPVEDTSGTYAAAGLNLDGYGDVIRLEGCIIRTNTSYSAQSPDGGFAVQGGDGTLLIVDNNLINLNYAYSGVGAGEIDEPGNSAAVFIVNNTVTGNTVNNVGGGIAGGLVLASITNNTLVQNNIFHGNTTYGLVLNAPAHLYYNDIGVLGGSAMPWPDSIGTVSVAPKFVDASNGDYHLSGASTLLGIGHAFSGVLGSSLDLDGHDYPYQGRVDLGAYQETIFVDGFDGD